MGQPKFSRKKYDTPSHPWQGDRIKAENEVKAKFGLKNKTEIWKAQTRLREIRSQARGLISRTRNPFDEQAAAEAKLLLRRLHRQGYIGEEATLNDVLGMDMERILQRRLQSQVYLKGLVRTPKQARQFVSHGCVLIGERRVTVPSYVVRREEEELIRLDPRKAIADENHPVRPRALEVEVRPERERTDRPERPARTEGAGQAGAETQGEAQGKAEEAAAGAAPGTNPAPTPDAETVKDVAPGTAAESKEASE